MNDFVTLKEELSSGDNNNQNGKENQENDSICES